MTHTLIRRAVAPVVLAIAGVLAVASSAHAQQNSTTFPWNSGGGGTGGYTSPGVYFPPVTPAFYPPANVESSRAFYPSMATADTVRINVTAPAEARITFDGAMTSQTGTLRRYVSPAIAAGRYSYEIQATWMENGREVRQSRSVQFEPGDVVQVTITRDGMTVRTEP
jgi:uncharacterized protein (TIGR03000 family)